MTESFDRRKTELEIAAKNTIVEIYLIREKREEIDNVLDIKESYCVMLMQHLKSSSIWI